MEMITKGMVFKSNTEYVASQSQIDIYLEDTFFCDNKEARSTSRTMAPSCQVGFLLENLENVVLDFNNATIMFHGRIVPFVVINCRNLVIKNLKIDYDRPFYTQADVLSVESGKIEIKIDNGFDYEVKDGYLYAKSETWEKNLNANDCLLWFYDKSGKKAYDIMLGLFGEKIYPNENPPLPIQQLGIEDKGESQIITGDFPDGWDYNDGNNVLLITHEVRDKPGFSFVGGSDIKIENCIFIHGAAMGAIAMHTRNITFDRYCMYCDYNGNRRMVTTNADAIHCFNCYGKIEIKNCHMEGLLDDTVNVHCNYFSVKSIEENVLTMYSHSVEYLGKNVWFCKGDKIGIYRGRTLEKVTELEISDIRIDEENKVQYFTVKGDTSLISPEDTVENLSAQPEIYIHDCTFGQFRGTMRLQSRSKTVIENCLFSNKELALLFSGDTTYWYESGPVNDMVVKGCTFKYCNLSCRINADSCVEFSEKEKYYHKNIRIENCLFEDGDNIAALKHVDDFVFRNNKCTSGAKIITEKCGNIYSDIKVTEAGE